jgi:small nuclear ribonucleoprotein (snRNP)-like protein
VFAPLANKEKQPKTQGNLFKQFLNKLRKLRISLITSGRRELIASLKSIDKQIKGLLASLEGEE